MAAAGPVTDAVRGSVAMPFAAAASSFGAGAVAAAAVATALAATVAAALAAATIAAGFGVGRRGSDGDTVIGETDAERHDRRDQRDRAAARKQGRQ
ncbi:MAG: hypothetical protein IID49_15720 [Proteobacteria bacterium]|nr:hypothetical protein [Pseudomonadota bacterium]